MRKILILGAGLSSSSLIRYLLDNAEESDWRISVADLDVEMVKVKINGSPYGEAIKFNVEDETQLSELVSSHDLVISMLPARMHYDVAVCCVKFKKNMVTASYVSKEIKALDEEAKKAGIIILNEIGVDPGIDHMSAMQIIDRIRDSGGRILGFESSTGGLVAPEFDNNPWNYKFTWNPRNVVLAGQEVSKFLQKGRYKYVPYHRLFSRIENVTILDMGEFEIYPNRDSLKYKKVYGLDNIGTLFRGTIRRPGFSEAWNVFVQLGVTDDDYIIENSEEMTYRQFINSFLFYEPNVKVETKLAKYVGIEEDSEIMRKLIWTGIFEKRKIGLKNATPAKIVQQLLEPKWALEEGDIDMIVMHHILTYEKNGEEKQLSASMVVKGEDKVHTAMSMTVGLPVAIATKMILNNNISVTGVQVPINRNIYEPVMSELEEYGIKFIERELYEGH